MKLLISLLFSIIILSSNLYASENSKDNFIKKSNANTQEITPKLSNEQLQELIKKLQRENCLRWKKYVRLESMFYKEFPNLVMFETGISNWLKN